MPRRRIRLFDGGGLSAYLAAPRHRLVLADLLASFARISGGVVLAPDGRHRRQWNDADPHRLVVLLDAVPPAQRRRCGGGSATKPCSWPGCFPTPPSGSCRTRWRPAG